MAGPGWIRAAALLAACGVAAGAVAATRTWTDSTGGFRVEAQLVAVEGEAVRLRRSDGREITVPVERLSEADRAYVQSLSTAGAADAEVLADMAERFFADLRTEPRAEARSLLTPKAQKLGEEGVSPLDGLPSPDEHPRAINVRDPDVLDNWANVPVRVRAGGKRVSTTLRFVRLGGEWRIVAISADLPQGEATLDFEVAPNEQEDADPLRTLVGKPMPLDGLTLDGRRFDIGEYRGRVVLVDFWATWCGPCRREMPNILANYDEYHAEGFEVIAVSTDTDIGALEDYVAEEQPPWVVLADRHPKNRESMSARYGIRSIPSLVLVGPDGRVTAVHTRGKRLGEALERLIRAPRG